MAKKRKTPKLTPEDRARHEDILRAARERIAERERIEAARAAKRESA
jgi:hypothetical protein